MVEPRKVLQTPNRSLASNRWSVEEDNLLLELIQQQYDWTVVAGAMKRSLRGVQHRFQFLKKNRLGGSAVVAKVSVRAQDERPAPNLTCGAISKVGRRVVEAVKSEIREFYGRPIVPVR